MYHRFFSILGGFLIGLGGLCLIPLELFADETSSDVNNGIFFADSLLESEQSSIFSPLFDSTFELSSENSSIFEQNIPVSANRNFILLEETDLKASETEINTPEIFVLRGGKIADLKIDPYSKRFFFHNFGEWGTNSSGDSDSGFKQDSFGSALGYDFALGENVVLGGGFGASWVNLKTDNSLLKEKINAYFGFVHLSLFSELWYLDLSLSWGSNQNKNQWKQSLTSSVYNNNYNGTQTNYYIEAGYRIRNGFTVIRPFLGVRYIQLEEPGHADVYPGSSVYVPLDCLNRSARMLLGVHFSWKYTMILGEISPFMQLGWGHEFGSRSLFSTCDLMEFPTAFRLYEQKMGRDQFLIQGGMTAALKETVDLFAYYNLSFSQNRIVNNLMLGFNKKF